MLARWLRQLGWGLALGALSSAAVAAPALSPPASAEPPPAAAAPRAAPDESPEALIQHGIELRKTGDDRGALAAFQDAFALGASARALAQMALARLETPRWSPDGTPLPGANRSPIIE